MKLDIYIMAPELNGVLHKSLLSASKQRLGKNVAEITNSQATIE
jgi:hypothetical protein